MFEGTEKPRPERGLGVREALKFFTPSGDYAAYKAAEELAVRPMPPEASGALRKAFEKWRDKVELPLAERLLRGTLIASGIHEHRHRREIIDRNLFELMWIDYDEEQIVGRGQSYEAPEIFEPDAVPLNIDFVPEWVLRMQSRPGFMHDETYENVSLSGTVYVLGPKQAIIVEILHRAYLRGKPWVSGRELLDRAKSRSEHVMDLFKGDNSALIVSDKRRNYRLNLAQPGV
jgi:hypothetical protein